MNSLCNRSRGISPWKVKPLGGLSSSALKILAIVLMISDHLWATVIPGNNWMTYLGRIAFPIFAFQITEGYFHTSDKKQYQKRLFIAALISEIPFNLLMMSSPIFPFHQNVMFTLLLGLRAMDGLEFIRQNPSGKFIARGLLRLAACAILAVVGFVDYGLTGLLTILVFYIFRGFPLAWLGQLIAMVFLHVILFEGQTIPIAFGSNIHYFPTQGFAVFSLLPIWLYNGEKGQGGKVLQYGSYLFYPAHMLLLHLARTLF